MFGKAVETLGDGALWEEAPYCLVSCVDLELYPFPLLSASSVSM